MMCRLLVVVAATVRWAGASTTEEVKAESGSATLMSCEKIWDAAPHNAFTSLVRFRGAWYCAFREGEKHVSPDGALRVISSEDGNAWISVARITHGTADLRDAQLAVTPDGRLMLSGAAALHQPAEVRHQTMAYFSEDGRSWGAGVPIGEPDFWLWRVTWHRNTAYGIGYTTTGEDAFVRLYTSPDGEEFTTLLPRLHDKGAPNEAALCFNEDGSAICLLRRKETGLIGQASPPYTDWQWRDLGVAIGGPNLIRLPDGRYVGAVRLYEPRARTALCWIDPEVGRLREFLTLPSGGDTSYPGLVFHDGLLWVSYYASHEAKTCIYLAQVRF